MSVTYDLLGRLLTSQKGELSAETYGYDSTGLIWKRPGTATNLTTWYTNDAAGRRTAERNPNGENTWFTYTPSGDLQQLTDGNRYYNPSLQRWINRDPIRERGFSLVRERRNIPWNVDVGAYEFALNAPVRNYDPLGLDIDDCLAGCDQDRKNAGIQAITELVEETWYVHSILAVGTVGSMLCKSPNAILIFGVLDAFDLIWIVTAGSHAEHDAVAVWKKCCTNCGVTYKDPESAKWHMEHTKFDIN